MGRQMHVNFAARLTAELQTDGVRHALRTLCALNISTVPPNLVVEEARLLYSTLSAPGVGGLSQANKRFCVGATKVMNFLFPELLVMLDKYAARGVGLRRYNNFDAYWSVEKCCHKELQEWVNVRGNVGTLIALDYPAPSTATRIFDKCALVMGYPPLTAVYRTLTPTPALQPPQL